MSDDYELDDLPCPVCQYTPTHTRQCSALHCTDGFVDETEYDPLEGDADVRCDECYGSGIERWCPYCALDISRWIYEHPEAAEQHFKTHDEAYYDDDPGLRVGAL